MKKYIILFFFFTMLCVIGYEKEFIGAVLIGASLAGYCLSRIQYKYSKKYRFRDNNIYTYIASEKHA